MHLAWISGEQQYARSKLNLCFKEKTGDSAKEVEKETLGCASSFQTVALKSPGEL